MSESLSHLSRAQLAQLGREYMVGAHFNGRCGYAALALNHGTDAYKDVAIDNWMGASPVYTNRMQQAMGFAGGTDVATIFRGLQLECGFAHQYFDVHFELLEGGEGRFWLNSCGPLLETEPRGDDAVRTMCHDIEDPTFDATAIATNPRARMRPVHRPPRVPVDRAPHCEWRVFIDPDAEPLVERPITADIRATQLAQVEIGRGAGTEPGGMDDYTGELLEQMQLERFSHGALVALCGEFAVQGHLLVMSLMHTMHERYGLDAALQAVEFQMEGSCRVMSERLVEWLGLRGEGVDDLIAVLGVHPAFQPREYFGLEVTRADSGGLRLTFAGDAPAARETLPYGWYQLLQRDKLAGLNGLLQGVDPRARAAPVAGEAPAAGKALAFDVTLDGTPATEEPLSLQIARGTVLYRTQLENHIPLLEL